MMHKFIGSSLLWMNNMLRQRMSVICLSLLLICPGVVLSAKSKSTTSSHNGNSDCVKVDDLCLHPWDVLNYEAIRSIHAQLDDDQNGDIDLSESVDFLREELNYTKDVEKKQEVFHHNNDQHISVQELWNIWITSEVYNWTTEQTVSWLTLNVELGQYSNIFYDKTINGSILPRLATNYDQILTRMLGIKNPAHRSKISIKAMDVVLFGSPKDTASYVKDITIVLLVTFLIVGAFRFTQVRREFQNQRTHMIQEMDALHQEERTFREEMKQRDSIHRMSLSPASKPDCSSNDNSSEEQMEENIKDRVQFGLGDDTEQTDGLSPRSALQLWLQLTYEKERDVFEAKCKLLEAQLDEAKEMAERLKPSKKQVFVALGLVPSKTEPKYEAITEAVRRSIADIKQLHKEITFRWETIEKLSGFDIVNNPGLNHLELLLEPEFQCHHKAPFPSPIVEQLLKSQSALIFLTLGGYSGVRGLKQNGLRNYKKKTKNNRSPETGSVKSASSLHSRDSSRTLGNIQQSNTIASGLGNSGSETLPVDNKAHGTSGEAQTAVESQIVNGKELKKQDTVSSIGSHGRTSSDANTTQVRKKTKPFLKSYSQDAAYESRLSIESWKEAAAKCHSEPALESEEFEQITNNSVIMEDNGSVVTCESTKIKSRTKTKFSKMFSFRVSKRSKTHL